MTTSIEIHGYLASGDSIQYRVIRDFTEVCCLDFICNANQLLSERVFTASVQHFLLNL